MARKYLDNLEIEGARIIFRNFSGTESKYNRKGDRNFCVLLEDDNLVHKLTEEGWNVKKLSARDETGIEEYYLPVSVRFDNFPPNIYQVTRRGKLRLDEDTVKHLDFADIASADLIINPYCYETDLRSGVKAYLKTAYIVLNEDRFAEKYADPFDRVDDEYYNEDSFFDEVEALVNMAKDKRLSQKTILNTLAKYRLYDPSNANDKPTDWFSEALECLCCKALNFGVSLDRVHDMLIEIISTI